MVNSTDFELFLEKLRLATPLHEEVDMVKIKMPIQKWRNPFGKHVVASRYIDFIPEERRNRCEKCGAEYTRLEGHHKIPRHEGGGDDEENLETLCVRCHAKVDKYRARFLGWSEAIEDGVIDERTYEMEDVIIEE